MPRFLSTTCNRHINADEVKSFHYTRRGDKQFGVIVTKDGESYTVDGRICEWLEKGEGPAFPSLPGYFRIILVEKTNDELADFTDEPILVPIIGWKTIDGFCATWISPIDADESDDELSSFILCPNGMVVHQLCATYRSLAEFIADRNKSQKARRLKRRAELLEMFG